MPSPADRTAHRTADPAGLAALCAAVEAELRALDPAGVLAGVATAAGVAAAGRGTDALKDPAFALDVLACVEAAGLDDEVAPLVARVLELLRRRSGTVAPAGAPLAPTRTLDEALAEYETTGFLALSPNARRTYRTWTRRLAIAHGAADVATVRTGDLSNLITARLASRPDPRAQRVRRVTGVRTHITAVQAFRHFWAWLDAMGYADAAVAKALRLPGKPRSSHRRGYTRAEAAVVRQLCRVGSDPMLDTLVIMLAERALLRTGEILLLRLCDLDFAAGTIDVWGKGSVPRTIPMTPGLREFLLRYVEDRRPVAQPHLQPRHDEGGARPRPQHPHRLLHRGHRRGAA
ncbi:MAG TPA: site-specific integrase [Frankiaceae bacterium]|nr:site-specific integrase [Frankiaceae bacterium]